MDYSRVTPRARSGTSGVSIDTDVASGSGVWISPPDRVAAITIAVHIPSGATGTFAIETTCSSTGNIGDTGNGGYWDNPYGSNVTLSENTTVMIANAVTGVRVRNITSTAPINVCFVG